MELPISLHALSVLCCPGIYQVPFPRIDGTEIENRNFTVFPPLVIRLVEMFTYGFPMSVVENVVKVSLEPFGYSPVCLTYILQFAYLASDQIDQIAAFTSYVF